MRAPATHVRLLPALALLVVVGCGGFEDGGGKTGARNAQAFCEKRDECGMLDGATLEECTEEMRECTDALRSAEIDEWDEAMDACAELGGCEPYFDCWTEVPYC